MSKCSRCLINTQMRLSDEPCCCAWFMDNIINDVAKSIDKCDAFIELRKCSPVKNMAFTSDYLNNNLYLENEIYSYNIHDNKYRVYVNENFDKYTDLSEEAFKECFFDMDI